jgi:[ribosomal protein S5]-alanine N-acetyltransferase
VTGRRHDEGGRIYLRPLQHDDFDGRYLGWFADADVTRYLDARNITREEAVAHLEQGRQDNQWLMHAICRTRDDTHIGNLKIGPIRWRDGVSDLVTVIGDRSAWGHGYARAAISVGIAIAFDDLGLRKLSASIVADNVASLKAYQAAGFIEEARLKDQYRVERNGSAALCDKIFVACFNPAVRTVA